MRKNYDIHIHSRAEALRSRKICKIKNTIKNCNSMVFGLKQFGYPNDYILQIFHLNEIIFKTKILTKYITGLLISSMGNYYYYRLQEVTLIRNCYPKWIVHLKQHYRLMITHLKNRKNIKWRLQQCALDYLQILIIFADTRAKEYIAC